MSFTSTNVANTQLIMLCVLSVLTAPVVVNAIVVVAACCSAAASV